MALAAGAIKEGASASAVTATSASRTARPGLVTGPMLLLPDLAAKPSHRLIPAKGAYPTRDACLRSTSAPPAGTVVRRTHDAAERAEVQKPTSYHREEATRGRVITDRKVIQQLARAHDTVSGRNAGREACGPSISGH